MQLPKQLKHDGVETDIRAALEGERIEMYAGSDIRIPHLKLTPKMRKSLFYAKATGEIMIGYEEIEKWLTNELSGLKKVGNDSERISRVLLVTNDGSPRFYRELEFLRNTQGKRVLICRLDVGSAEMADILDMKGSTVKSVLLNRKKSVINLFRSLISA